jgi:hypothetical protein
LIPGSPLKFSFFGLDACQLKNPLRQRACGEKARHFAVRHIIFRVIAKDPGAARIGHSHRFVSALYTRWQNVIGLNGFANSHRFHWGCDRAIDFFSDNDPLFQLRGHWSFLPGIADEENLTRPVDVHFFIDGPPCQESRNQLTEGLAAFSTFAHLQSAQNCFIWTAAGT